MLHSPLSRRPRSRALAWCALFGLAACAAPHPGANLDPSWPYARIGIGRGIPDVWTATSIYWGRWIEADPERGTVISESSDSRYLLEYSFDAPRELRVLDLGPDASLETMVFIDRGRAALFVGAVGQRETGTSVYARSLLRFDLEQSLLIDVIPLRREDLARGLVLDPQERRAFLLVDDGAGNGAIEVVDLYGGRSLLRRDVGSLPDGVRRKGLVADRTGRKLFCLTGGESAPTDFAPVDAEPLPPGLLVLDADSLTVEARIPLDERGTPVAAAYDPERDRVVVLETGRERSRVVIVDAGFGEIRERVDLQESASDLVLHGGYAFLPGPNGVGVVDLDRGIVTGYVLLALERTGELAVSPDGGRGLVLFQGGWPPGPPGVAVVALDTGTLLDVLQ